MFLLISIPMPFAIRNQECANFVFLIYIQLFQVSSLLEVIVFIRVASQCCGIGSHTFKTFLTITSLLKHNNIARLAETLCFTIFTFALDLYTVIHHAV